MFVHVYIVESAVNIIPGVCVCVCVQVYIVESAVNSIPGVCVCVHVYIVVSAVNIISAGLIYVRYTDWREWVVGYILLHLSA